MFARFPYHTPMPFLLSFPNLQGLSAGDRSQCGFHKQQRVPAHSSGQVLTLLGSPIFGILVANPHKRHHLRSLFREAHESGLPRFRTWLLSKPGIQASEIEGSRRESMLQMDFGLTSVACLAHAKGPDSLRKRTFNACSLVVLRFEHLRRLPLACGLKRLIAGLWAHRQ